MKRLPLILLLLALILGLTGRAEAVVRVVATTTPLAAVTKAVGGEHVAVTALALHTQNPHFVDARPHLALELANADLLVVTGLDLEVGWLPVLQTGARNGNIQIGGRGYLDCSLFVTLLDVRVGPYDRSMGDVHAGGNPHYMMDPRAAVAVAKAIGDRLAALDAEHAAAYKSGADQFAADVQARAEVWKKALAPLAKKKVVTYHRSLTYLANWAGFEIIGQLEPRPGIAPSPGHVARVIATAKKIGVGLIVQETYYPENLSRLAASKMGARLVAIPAGPDFRGGESYLHFVNRVVELLAKGAERK